MTDGIKHRFYLHNKASQDGYHPIYLEVRWGRHASAVPGTSPAVRLSTGKACQLKNWNADRERPKKDENLTVARLNELETLITDTLNLAAGQRQHVTPDELKAAVLAVVRPQALAALVPEPADVELADLPLPELATRWVERYRAKYSHSHLRKMKPLADHWQRFRPEGTTARELLPNRATQSSALVDSWAAYMLEEAPQRNGTLGMDSNSLGDYIKRLRLLIKFAGLPYDWLKDEYTYEKEGEPLTYGEVQALLDCPGLTPWLAQVRDTFVFACYTGPRFSNLSTLGPEAGTTSETLEYVQVKGRRNKRKVRVSLPPVAQDIWERYGGRLPVSCLQDFNRDIKKVAKLAGLDRPVLKVSYKGTERHERRGPLWEFLTSHVARHTYATLLLDGGADLGTVQLSLGHQNIQVTRRYAKTREVARASQTLSAFERLAASHTPAESVRTMPPTDTAALKKPAPKTRVKASKTE